MHKYIVIEEKTLGYVLSERPNSAGILGRLIGGYDWKNGPISIFSANTRAATIADFKKFRVQLPPDFQLENSSKSSMAP
jgi:hypothetical protein